MYDSVGSRFEEALTIKYGKKNNKEIADKYGYTQQAIGKLKTKEAINETICIISEKENINLNWLQTGKGEIFLSTPSINKTSQTIKGNGNISVNGNFNHTQTSNTSNIKDDSLIEIPYLEDVYASAGGGAINYSDAPKPMAFSSEFLKIHLGISSFKNLHIINAIGNSMEPTIQEGEFLFVNPFENEFNQIKDGGIYVINCNNSVFVKRINHNPITGAVILMSDNHKIPDIQINGQEFESCVIIGRVVGHFSSL